MLKVSQSRAIIDRFCQDEGFELTYYIETLGVALKTLTTENVMKFKTPSEALPQLPFDSLLAQNKLKIKRCLKFITCYPLTLS